MKVLYYDCFSGISGDMNLGALIDLGVPEKYLRAQLALLGVEGYTLTVSREQRNGITGTRVDVALHDHHDDHHGGHHVDHHSTHHDDHHHTDHHDSHHSGHKDKNPKPHHGHSHDHEHRNLSAISGIIQNSKLSARVKKTSIDIFTRIAKAEAKVHDKPVDKIHFHEVGAIDSIVDIAGAAICIEYLRVDAIKCSTIELGSGFVECRHGRLPVPAPATVEIACGLPVRQGGVPFEATTPTGAAILAATVSEFTDTPSLSISAIGYGVGYAQSESPNLLRVLLGETLPARQQLSSDGPVVVECNIDDMNPEWYDYIFKNLFALGADDVYLIPIIMKKSRPANILSVLCSKNRQKIIDWILAETSTLGVRIIPVEKRMLDRAFSSIETPWGDVRIKSGLMNGVPVKSKPEYADCAALAAKSSVPISAVYAEVQRLMPSAASAPVLPAAKKRAQKKK